MFKLVKASGLVRLTSHQERRDLLWLSENEAKASNICNFFKIEGRIAEGLIERSIVHALTVHEALRTGFETEGDGAWARNVRDEAPQTPLSFLETGQDEQEIIKAIRAEFNHRFEPDDYPLFKVVVAYGESTTYFGLILAHVISDVTSNRLVIASISNFILHEGNIADGEGEPAHTLSDFVLAQSEWLETAESRKKLALFEDTYGRHVEQVRSADPRYGERVLTAHLPILHFEAIPENVMERALRLAAELKISQVLFFKGIAGLAMAAAFGREKHFVSVIFANRHVPGTESIAGHFGSYLPVLFDTTAFPTVREYLSGISRQWLFNTFHFGAIPIGVLDQVLAGEDSSFRKFGLFNRSVVNFLPLPAAQMIFAGRPYSVIPEARAMYLTTHDAQIVFRAIGNTMDYAIKCPTDHPELLLRLKNAFETVLTSAIETPAINPVELWQRCSA